MAYTHLRYTTVENSYNRSNPIIISGRSLTFIQPYVCFHIARSQIIENEQAFAYQQSSRCGGVFGGLSLDEDTAVIMSHSVVIERYIQLADFYELRFEDRTLPEIMEQAGWLLFVQRTWYASKNLVQEFYASILQARDVEEPSMKVTVWKVQIIFSPDELALFLGYVRDVTAFPNVPMTEEATLLRPRFFERCWARIRLSWRVSNMLHGQLHSFWRIMHLILCSTIDLVFIYGQAEFLYMVVVRGLHVDMASFIYQSSVLRP
ncbi:hypothetical protein CJ030_MR1G019081 [Morella rubra]|uniref:Uncharacterized protein n=1 Tax=Morella rubra TaxID=262757 RepID=A0A6A1WV56_9ROSI|nr:hypothetical protein CJ030_MR1G019081 [Morella rubra]